MIVPVGLCQPQARGGAHNAPFSINFCPVRGPAPHAYPRRVCNCELPERLFRLDREPIGDVRLSIKSFQNVIADQAAIFAGLPLQGGHLDAPIAGVAFRALNVSFFHAGRCLVSSFDQRIAPYRWLHRLVQN